MSKTKSIKTSFIGSNGNRLDARLELPATTPIEYIVFSHCFTCTKDILTAYRGSRLLAQKGYAVLRFDFAGLGDSEGDFSECNFTTTVDDLHAAIQFLDENYRAPSILIGHSLGGTTSLAVATTNPHIKKVITIASPSQPAHVLHHFDHALIMLEQDIASSFEVAGNFYDIKPQFVTDVRSWDMQTQLVDLNKPVLIFKIENDALVDEHNADDIAQWVNGKSTITNLKNTDHLLSNKQAHANAIELMIKWLEKN